MITSDEARRDWKIEGPHFGGMGGHTRSGLARRP